MDVNASVAAHYDRDDLLSRIDEGLKAAGLDPQRLTIRDLVPLDELHSRGRAATEEVMAALPAALDGPVLDVGSGLGGPARYLAETRGQKVLGVDLTPGFVAAANELSRRCGLDHLCRFEVADALHLPIPDAHFPAAFTIHVAMNIPDKAGLYREVARVLRPGATFVVFDVLARPGQTGLYPTPWAKDESTSFLVDVATLEGLLSAAGFEILERQDRTPESIDFFEKGAAKAAVAKPALGSHIMFGEDFAPRRDNLIRNLREGRMAPTLVVARKAA